MKRFENAKVGDSEILDWIEKHQQGRGGIYPHHVALEVCAVFGITIESAREYVLHHICDVLNKGI